MLFMVCFLLVMIFIYASGYMTFPGHLRKEQYPDAYAASSKDPRYSRFMAYISLFATGMLGLVVSNSLITFFVFWEIMGLCSYLLIGFWYEKGTAQARSLQGLHHHPHRRYDHVRGHDAALLMEQAAQPDVP